MLQSISVERAALVSLLVVAYVFLGIRLLRSENAQRSAVSTAGWVCVLTGLWLIPTIVVDRLNSQFGFYIAAMLTFTLAYPPLLFFLAFAQAFPAKLTGRLALIVRRTLLLVGAIAVFASLHPELSPIQYDYVNDLVFVHGLTPQYIFQLASMAAIATAAVSTLTVQARLAAGEARRAAIVTATGFAAAVGIALTVSAANRVTLSRLSLTQYIDPPISLFIAAMVFAMVRYGALGGLSFSMRGIKALMVTIVVLSVLAILA